MSKRHSLRGSATIGSILAMSSSVRTIARLMTIGRDLFTKSEIVTIAATEQGTPPMVDEGGSGN